MEADQSGVRGPDTAAERAQAIAILKLTEKLCECEEISRKRDDNIRHLTRLTADLQEQLSQKTMECKALTEVLSVYEHSRSWRVTRPLRSIGRACRCGRNVLSGLSSSLQIRSVLRTLRESLAPFRTGIRPLSAGRPLPQEVAASRRLPAEAESEDSAAYWDLPEEERQPLVSVIVPGFNHEPYLRQRLDSIYGQTYRNIEVILLDDASADGSAAIMREYADRDPNRTRLMLSDRRSGRPFLQWEKGLRMARGELVWIAESDDWCEEHFLETMVPLFERRSVMLAFCRSIFVCEGKENGDSEAYLERTAGGNWRQNFIRSAGELAEQGFSARNLIVNVSSAVFRRPEVLPEKAASLCRSMQLCADWVFYLTIMRGGLTAYTRDTVNYYRVHRDSTSLKVQKTDRYYREYEAAMRYAAGLYPAGGEKAGQMLRELQEHYRQFHPESRDGSEVRQWFHPERIPEAAAHRLPSVLISCFSLQAGGGEVYALYLANALNRLGVPVTLLDLSLGRRDPEIAVKADNGLPVFHLRSLNGIYQVLHHMKADIVHSHHASSDEAFARWLSGSGLPARLVITLHGMYELMPEDTFRTTMRSVSTVCRRYLYLTEKNLIPFRTHGLYDPGLFTRMPNGVPAYRGRRMSREELGISSRAFVLVTASRGIPEKGWAEAIQAVKTAREMTRRDIRLLLLGDGEMRRRLEPDAPKWAVFTGIVSHPGAYFSICDAGLLATRFPGESFPLSVAECLMCGRPVIATDIGEVRNMLSDRRGDPAGALLHLSDGRIDVTELSRTIAALAADERYYRKLRRRCPGAALKFDMEKIAGTHLEVYRECMRKEHEPDQLYKERKAAEGDPVGGELSAGLLSAAAGVSLF